MTKPPMPTLRVSIAKFPQMLLEALGGNASGISSGELEASVAAFLTAGLVVAQVDVQLGEIVIQSPRPPDEPEIESTGEEDDDDDLDDDLLDDDADMPGVIEAVKGRWNIANEFWASASFHEVARTGVAHVHANFLSSPKRESVTLASKRPDQEILFDLKVWVSDPYQQIQEMLEFLPPAEDLVSRYRFAIPFLYEIIAVIWRYIALTKMEDGRGINTQLLNAAREYISNQDLDPGGAPERKDKTLQNIIRHIVRQWRSGNHSSSVLVSSKDDTPTHLKAK